MDLEKERERAMREWEKEEKKKGEKEVDFYCAYEDECLLSDIECKNCPLRGPFEEREDEELWLLLYSIPEDG